MNEVVRTSLEVRWGECDAAGIVYHPNYFDWFSVARMRFLAENGIRYMEKFHNQGIVLVVLDTRSIFKKSLTAEDKVHVDARMTLLTRTRIRMEYDVLHNDGDRRAYGYTDHAYVDLKQRPVNIAKRLPDVWDELQALPISSSVEF